MTEQESVKVFELAKELGIPSVTLVDKLKALGMNVKSHMSGLTSGELETARNALKPKADKEAKPAKTVTRRKKADAPSDDAKATAATAAGTAQPSSGSSVIKRKKTTEDTAQTQATPSAKTATGPKIIRRSQSKTQEPKSTLAQELEASLPPSVEATETEVDDTSETPSEETQASAEEFSPEINTPPSSPLIIKPVEKAPSAPKRSFLVTSSAPVLPPKKAKPAAETKPGEKAGVITDSKKTGGARIINMTKENLDRMAEEEAAKKRAAGAREDIKPEDQDLSDYFKKKEIFFVPKKKKIPIGKTIKSTKITERSAHKRVIEMHDTISVQELANQLGVKAADVIKKLMAMGQMVTANQALDFDTVTLLAAEYKWEVKNISFDETSFLTEEADETALKPRPPIVTIMGHVDHGKTSLLDAIRQANVAAKEAGGITQHIGAYTIEKNGKKITFIDTPGHEAFTSMRARGAKVTDIVVLVVAADDGVMPQTREALSHAKAAGVPIVVAVNKIDKPGANPDKIKQGLSELDLLAEDWGGETMFIPVSATQKTNLNGLLEGILLNAEMAQLKANPDAPAKGTVLEARLEKGRGPVASVVVQNGTLRRGDAIIAGMLSGRIKGMTNHLGEAVSEVPPGEAAEILGLNGVPGAGEVFQAVKDESTAQMIVKDRLDRQKLKDGVSKKMTLEELFSKVQQGNMKELKVVLKADVFGSVEAVKESLLRLSTDRVKVTVILAAAGGITESDVLLASASNAVIIGFNVRPETKAMKTAENEQVEIKCYNIIYELIDEVKKAMGGLLDKKKIEKVLGRAEVRQTFVVPKLGVIAGSSVIDGKMVRGSAVRLLRDQRVIFEGKMSSLKRFKDDAREVQTGFECGIGIENYNDIKLGDVIEAYEIELITQSLEEATQNG